MALILPSASLFGVFPASNEAARDSIAFMDNYLQHSARGDIDFGLLLRYSCILVNLTHHFESTKDQFLRLCYPFEFPIELPKMGRCTTSCHVLELLLRARELGSAAVLPILNALALKGGGTDAIRIFLTSELPFTQRELDERFADLRRTIGVMRYCLANVVPKAKRVVQVLQAEDPRWITTFTVDYHTLRALGCWIAAATRFVGVDCRAQGRRLLRHCVAVLDAASEQQQKLPLSLLARSLRASAAYEVDMRLARRLLAPGPPHVPERVALSVAKRAHAAAVVALGAATAPPPLKPPLDARIADMLVEDTLLHGALDAQLQLFLVGDDSIEWQAGDGGTLRDGEDPLGRSGCTFTAVRSQCTPSVSETPQNPCV